MHFIGHVRSTKRTNAHNASHFVARRSLCYGEIRDGCTVQGSRKGGGKLLSHRNKWQNNCQRRSPCSILVNHMVIGP